MKNKYNYFICFMVCTIWGLFLNGSNIFAQEVPVSETNFPDT